MLTVVYAMSVNDVLVVKGLQHYIHPFHKSKSYTFDFVVSHQCFVVVEEIRVLQSLLFHDNILIKVLVLKTINSKADEMYFLRSKKFVRLL